MKFANLHLHSNCSDSQFTPEQLVIIGKALGYGALALTDHETDCGVREFMAHAENEGIGAVTGAEFYGVEDGVTLHLTALDYDMDDPSIRAFVKERCRLQAAFTQKCVERGIKLGFIEGLAWCDVLDYSPDDAWLCIDSVMQAMKLKKLVDADYDWGAFRNHVFKGPEVKAFKHKPPLAKDVIRVVRRAGGIVALAHPNKQVHFVEKLVGYGLNGIEVCHPQLDDEQAFLAMEAAKEFNLYACGGTDHTGPMSGCGGKNAIAAYHGITQEQFVVLKERCLG